MGGSGHTEKDCGHLSWRHWHWKGKETKMIRSYVIPSRHFNLSRHEGEKWIMSKWKNLALSQRLQQSKVTKSFVLFCNTGWFCFPVLFFFPTSVNTCPWHWKVWKETLYPLPRSHSNAPVSWVSYRGEKKKKARTVFNSNVIILNALDSIFSQLKYLEALFTSATKIH